MMKPSTEYIVYIFFSFLLMGFTSHGQSSNEEQLEGLRDLLREISSPKEELLIRKEIDQLLRFSNAQDSYLNGIQALESAIQLKDYGAQAYWYDAIAKAQFVAGKYNDALDTLEIGFNLAIEHKDTIQSQLANSFGIIYRDLGAHEIAIKHFQLAIELSDSLEVKHHGFYPLINMASLLRKEKDFEAAEGYLLQGLEKAFFYNSKKMKAYAHLHLSSLFIETNRLDSAILYAKKSLSYCANERFGPYISISGNINLSRAYRKNGELEKAMSYAENALKLAETVHSFKSTNNAHFEIIEILIQSKAYGMAIEKLNQLMVTLNNKESSSHELRTIKLLEKVYTEQGAFKEAYQFNLKADSIQHTLNEKRQEFAIVLAEKTLHLKLRENENARLKAELIHDRKQLKLSNAFGVIMSLFALIVLLLTYSAFRETKFISPSVFKKEPAQNDFPIKKDFANLFSIIAMGLLLVMTGLFFYWGQMRGVIGTAIAELTLVGIILLIRQNRFREVFYLSSLTFYPLVIYGAFNFTEIAPLALGIITIYIIISFLATNQNLNKINIVFALFTFIICNIITQIPKEYDPIYHQVLGVFLSISSITMVILTALFFNRNIQDFKVEIGQNTSFLKQIINLNPNFIYAKNKDKKYIFANQSMMNAFDIDKESILGTGQDAIYNSIESSTDSTEEEDERVLEDGDTIVIDEEKIIDKNLQTRWLNTVKKPIYDNKGNITGLLGVSSEITAKKLAEKELQKSKVLYKTLVEASPCGIATADINGKITYASQTAAEIFGFTKEEVLGKSLTDFLFEEEWSRIPEYFQLFKKEDSIIQAQFKCLHQSGKVFYSEGNCRPIYDDQGHIKELLLVFFDTTEKIQQQLVIKNQLVDLNKKNEELEKYIESNMELENFAYIASHDLRAPIRTIISFSQLLGRSLGQKMTDREKEYMEFIISSSSNMNNLINDLLTYSRVNNTEINIESFDFKMLIDETLLELDALVQEKQPVIEFEDLPGKFCADATKIKQLLQNLITNALKFDKPDVPLEITIGAIERELEWVFWVKDNGIGIAEEFHQKIFALFKRLHTMEQYEGTGIGLSLCKKIVEQHKGRIWVESQLGVGTTFYFTIKKMKFLEPSLSTDQVNQSLVV